MFVDPPKPLGYNFSVAASAVTRRDNRQTLGAQAPSKGAFLCLAPLLWRAMQGRPQGLAVCLVHGLSPLHRSPPSS